MDWRDCIDLYDRSSSLMYLDPPYVGNGANYKHNMRGADAHRELALRLTATKCQWILSSYDKPEIREMFDQYVITPVRSYSGMKTGVAEEKTGRKRTLNREILITNFKPASGQEYLIPTKGH